MDKRMAAANIKAGLIKFIGTDSAGEMGLGREASKNSVMFELLPGDSNYYPISETLNALGLKIKDIKAIDHLDFEKDGQPYIYSAINEMLKDFNEGPVKIRANDGFSNLREVIESLVPGALNKPQYLVLSDEGVKKLHTALIELGASHPVIEAANEIILEKEGKLAPGAHSRREGQRRGSGRKVE